MDKINSWLHTHLPYTYEGIIKNVLNKSAKTVIDFGCGDGTLMKYLNRKGKFDVTGIDGFAPFLNKARKAGAYKKLIKADILKFSAKTKYDICFSSQVIEYFSKKDGEVFLDKLESIAKRQIIIGTYIGKIKHKEYENNPFQTGKYGWCPDDLKKRGYRVFGQGFKYIYKDENYIHKMPFVFRTILMVISYLASPIVYYSPGLAAHMIAVKNIDAE